MKKRERIRSERAWSGRARGERAWSARALSRCRVALTAGALALVLMAALPEALYACPVCFDRDDEARIAFLATTALLTLLPLGMVVGTGAWLRRRARELDEEERDEE